jgi:hypothetical protein
VTIATALFLNGVAVIALLALLAATMRLPYRLPTTPRSGLTQAEDSHRHRETAPASRRSRQERGAPEPVYSR